MTTRIEAIAHSDQSRGELLSLGRTCLIVGGARFDGRRRGVFLYSDRVTELDGKRLLARTALGIKCCSPGLGVLPGNAVLACGGQAKDGVLDGSWLWSHATNTWRPGPSMKTSRVNPRVFVQPNGRALVIGGVVQHRALTIEIDDGTYWPPPQVEQYVPTEGTDSASFVSVECPIQPVLAALLTSGDVLVAEEGARWELGRNIVSCIRLTPDGQALPAADAPSSSPKMSLVSLPRGRAMLIYTDGKTAIYEEGSDLWIDGPNLRRHIGQGSACAIGDGRVMVIGGDFADPETRHVIYRDEITLIDPLGGSVVDAGRLCHRRRSPQLAVLDDSVIVFGGVFPGDEGELTLERWIP